MKRRWVWVDMAVHNAAISRQEIDEEPPNADCVQFFEQVPDTITISLSQFYDAISEVGTFIDFQTTTLDPDALAVVLFGLGAVAPGSTRAKAQE